MEKELPNHGAQGNWEQYNLEGTSETDSEKCPRVILPITIKSEGSGIYGYNEKIKFFIRSPEITPAVEGYIAYSCDESADIGLVAYVPTPSTDEGKAN